MRKDSAQFFVVSTNVHTENFVRAAPLLLSATFELRKLSSADANII